MALPLWATWFANLRGAKGDKGDTGSIAFATAEKVGWNDEPTVTMVGPESARGAHFEIPMPLPAPETVNNDDATEALVLNPTKTRDALGVVIDGALAAASATVGSTLIGYGPSYMVGIRSTAPELAFFSLVGAAGGFGVTENRGVSGATAVENAYDAMTDVNGFAWTPRTDGGIVLVEPNINCVQLWGPALNGFAAALNATRALVALIRSRARVPADDAAFEYTGTWGTAGGAVNGNTVARSTTELDAKATFTFTGTEATVIVHAKDAAAGGTAYGPVAVSIDGGPETVYTLDDQAISYTPGSLGTRYGATIVNAPFPIRAHGLPDGVHTIAFRNVTSGHAVVIREAYLPATNPPGIVLIADAPRPDWSSSAAGGSNDVLAQYNQILWRVANEFGGPIAVADPTPGWVNATMSDIATHDGKHPTDLGHAHYAAAILPRMRGLGYNPAWTGWVSGDGWDGSTPEIDPGITDDFSGGTGASIVGRTTTTGDKVWAVTGGTTVQVTSGGIVKTLGGSGNSHAYIPLGDADHAVEATVVALPAGASTAIGGLAVRVVAASQDGIDLQIRETSSVMHYTLTKRVSGSTTTVATSTVVPAVGDRLRLEAIGTTVKAYVDDVEILSATVTEHATMTDAGCYFNRTDAGTFALDDFFAEAL